MENRTLYKWQEPEGGRGDSIRAELTSSGWVKISQRFNGHDKEVFIDNIDWGGIVTGWKKETARIKRLNELV